MSKPPASPKSLKLLAVKRVTSIVNPIELSKLVSRHFPDYPNPDGFEGLAIHLGQDGGHFFINLTEQIERLSRINKATRTIWNEFNQLPLSAQSAANLEVDLPVGEEVVPLIYLLRKLSYEMTGSDPWAFGADFPDLDQWPAKLGALDRAKAALTHEVPASTQQTYHKSGRKAQLARIAVIIWEECAARTAPSSPSPSNKAGSFYAFLDDLIAISGQKWGVERVMTAYKKSRIDT